MGLNMMLTIITGCLCIAGMEIVASLQGIDGMALAGAMTAIGGLIGGGIAYVVGKKKGQETKNE